MLDAEVMSEDFQALMKQVTRKGDVKTEDSYLAIFDALPSRRVGSWKRHIRYPHSEKIFR